MMRYSALSLLIFLKLTFVDGQKLDKVYPELSHIKDIRVFDTTGYLLITADAKRHFVNRAGEVTISLDLDLDDDSYKSVTSVFDGFPEQQDSFFYVTTIDDHCDYFLNGKVLHLNRYGDVLLENDFDDQYFPNGSYLFPPGPGHPKYILPKDNQILIWNGIGNYSAIPFRWYIETLDVNAFGDFAVLAHKQIYYYKNNALSFTLTDSVAVSNSPNYELRSLFFNADNNLVWFDKENMIIYDGQLDTIARFKALAGEKLIFVKESNSHLIVVSENADTDMRLYILALDGTVLVEKDLRYKKLSFSDVEFNGTNILFSGTEFYEEDKSYSFLKTFDLTNIEENRQDIEISNLRFDKVYSAGFYHCYWDSVRVHIVQDATIEITNKGTDTINSLTITPLKSYCFWWCDGERLYHHELTDMNLLPGETKEYSLGYVTIHVPKNISSDELCVTAILPDFKVDANHDDNVYCFDITTSSHDAQHQRVSLFPNPASDVLFLEPDLEMKRISVYNVNGVKAFDQEISDGNVDVSKLFPGVYFIRGEFAAGQVYIERFVKL